MFLNRASRVIRRQWRSARSLNGLPASYIRNTNIPLALFHASRNLQVVKPVLLADIGEGEKPREPLREAFPRLPAHQA